MSRPVSRAELARMAGVSRMAITKACRGQLAAAGLPGNRVDLDHETVRAYLKARGVEVPDRAPTAAVASRPKRGRNPPAGRRETDEAEPERTPRRRRRRASEGPDGSLADVPGPSEATAADVEGYAHLTLTELCDRFGTVQGFKDWLAALKLIEEVREKNLKNDETERRLIERDLVRTHVFGAMEAANRRLLGDSPKTITRRVYARAASGDPVEEAEAEVREIISSVLKPAKDTAARVLRDE